MNQREVELIFRTKGYERGIREVVMRIVEEQNDLRGMINETISAISSMASVLTALNVVADAMKYKIDRLSSKDDDGRSTQSVAEGD